MTDSIIIHPWFLLSALFHLLSRIICCVFFIVACLSELQYIPSLSTSVHMRGRVACCLLSPFSLLHICLWMYCKFDQCFQLLILSSLFLSAQDFMYSICLLNIAECYVFCMASSEAKSLVLATSIVCVILITDIFTYLRFFSITDKGVWVTNLFCSPDCYLGSIFKSFSFQPCPLS